MSHKHYQKDKKDGIVRLNVRIKKETYEALEREADDEMLPVAAIVRRLLRGHVRERQGAS